MLWLFFALLITPSTDHILVSNEDVVSHAIEIGVGENDTRRVIMRPHQAREFEATHVIFDGRVVYHGRAGHQERTNTSSLSTPPITSTPYLSSEQRSLMIGVSLGMLACVLLLALSTINYKNGLQLIRRYVRRYSTGTHHSRAHRKTEGPRREIAQGVHQEDR